MQVELEPDNKAYFNRKNQSIFRCHHFILSIIALHCILYDAIPESEFFSIGFLARNQEIISTQHNLICAIAGINVLKISEVCTNGEFVYFFAPYTPFLFCLIRFFGNLFKMYAYFGRAVKTDDQPKCFFWSFKTQKAK